MPSGGSVALETQGVKYVKMCLNRFFRKGCFALLENIFIRSINNIIKRIITAFAQSTRFRRQQCVFFSEIPFPVHVFCKITKEEALRGSFCAIFLCGKLEIRVKRSQ